MWRHFKVDAANAENIRFGGCHTPYPYTVMSETPLTATAPRQGRFLRHSPYQEGQDNQKFRG